MVTVKIFKCPGEIEKWKDAIGGLDKLGIKVYQEYSPADISIVLDGRYENPNIFDGEKILVIDKALWGSAWNMFIAVLSEYYPIMQSYKGVKKLYDLYIRLIG